MARPRTFDERIVIRQAAELFAAQGFNGTSIDDLVKITGLMRGSIYKAFGSKRNLFEASLKQLGTQFTGSQQDLDLLTIALKELASDDQTIADICKQIQLETDLHLAQMLGENLIGKMKGNTDGQS